MPESLLVLLLLCALMPVFVLMLMLMLVIVIVIVLVLSAAVLELVLEQRLGGSLALPNRTQRQTPYRISSGQSTISLEAEGVIKSTASRVWRNEFAKITLFRGQRAIHSFDLTKVFTSMKLTHSITSCFAISFLVSMAQAEVIEKSAHGFQVKHQVEVAVPREVAFTNFHAAIGQWWDSAHTWSRDASNLSLKPEAGASFLESLPNGGSCQHLEVVFVKPAEAIRLVGGLGPLQNEGVSGSLTITFEELDEDRTKMTWTYHVGGFVPQGLDAWAAPVDQVISLQCDRLKRYCETGKP